MLAAIHVSKLAKTLLHNRHAAHDNISPSEVVVALNLRAKEHAHAGDRTQDLLWNQQRQDTM
jgi:hypothetical protein